MNIFKPQSQDVLLELMRQSEKEKAIAVGIDIDGAGSVGGVRTGFDVVKMLALGADFILVGRPLAREAVSSGVEGVKRILEYIKTDVRIAMIMTSCNNLEDIDESILVKGS